MQGAPSTQAGEPVLRILIAEGLDRVVVEGVDLEVRDAVTGDPLPAPGGASRMSLTPGGGGILIDGQPQDTRHVAVSTPATWVVMGPRQYRGPLLIHEEGGALRVVNPLPMETYLPGLVASEMPPSWPEEALKAQAVASRSYALARLADSQGALFDLYASVEDQVYHGAGQEDRRALAAVRATRGQVLIGADGQVVEAFFHAICGGRTEAPSAVWPGKGAYPPPVRCEGCADAPGRAWAAQLSAAEVARRLRPLGFTEAVVVAVEEGKPSPGGRWATARITGPTTTLEIPGNELRRALGFSELKSTRLEAEVSGGVVRFKGVGFGHGVGLCQWGARGMASSGSSYVDILSHYYPGATLGRR